MLNNLERKTLPFNAKSSLPFDKVVVIFFLFFYFGSIPSGEIKVAVKVCLQRLLGHAPIFVTVANIVDYSWLALLSMGLA